MRTKAAYLDEPRIIKGGRVSGIIQEFKNSQTVDSPSYLSKTETHLTFSKQSLFVVKHNIDTSDKTCVFKELDSTHFYHFIVPLSHPPFITLEMNQIVARLTVGSPSISTDPDTPSHVLPVWWPHRPRHVQTAPRTQRRTRWMEGCTPSTRRTWGRLSKWWTTWGGVLLTVSFTAVIGFTYHWIDR